MGAQVEIGEGIRSNPELLWVYCQGFLHGFGKANSYAISGLSSADRLKKLKSVRVRNTKKAGHNQKIVDLAKSSAKVEASGRIK